MISALMHMATCHWSAHRIQRYLDSDPDAPLRADEIRRLETHLAVCGRCLQVLDEHRRLHRALQRWAPSTGPDEPSVARLHIFLEQLTDSEAS